MALDLNDTIEPYKDFCSDDAKTYIAQMSLLIADGRVPLSVANLMERRLNSPKTAWKDNYFDTGDAIAYSAGGDKVKIILDAQNLRSINVKSERKNGALFLEDGVYETLQGPEFKRSDLTVESDLSVADVKANPIWKALVRDDSLLAEYTDKMFAEMNQRFKYTDGMGIYLSSGEKVPTMRVAFVDRLHVRSRLNGWVGLGNGDSRLVGVTPKI